MIRDLMIRGPIIRGLMMAGLIAAFALLSIARPVDHDESQYVAAAMLSAHGLLPYRDYGYFQTPLQPFAFAPIAWIAGAWTWPALRLANALLGAVAVGATAAAARTAGASTRMAMAAAALFAGCDILLFSIGTARNDALPAALLAVALWLIVRGERDGTTRAAALAIGALLAAATAAKVSYALPAIAWGLMALVDRRRRPGSVLMGAAPLVAFVAWTGWLSPAGFWFGTLVFPSVAPVDWYAARPWKLSVAAKWIDVAKFLALGTALPALAIVVRQRGRRWPSPVEWLLAAGAVAALLPTPTWRQYLLPMLPPLFVLLALAWTRRPPTRGWRIAIAVFAVAGLAPTAVALAQGDAIPTGMAQGAAIRAALDRAGVTGPVVTLSPQFLPATGRLPDPRFAPGPFFFRSPAILSPADEAALALVSQERLSPAFAAAPPRAIVTGGEAWTSGDARLDTRLDAWAAANGYAPIAAGRFRVWVPRAAITPR